MQYMLCFTTYVWLTCISCYPATPTELSRHKSSNISQTRVCYTCPDPWNTFLCLWPQVRKTQTHIWAPDTTRRHPAMNIHAQSQLNITHLITSLPWNCFSGFIAFCVSWCASMHHMHVLLDYVMQHLQVQNKIQIFWSKNFEMVFNGLLYIFS